MPDRVPRFPPAALDQWDQLTLLAATIFLEAEDQGDLGQLAVGWVIRNRVVKWVQVWEHVILAPWQFSCWNAADRPHGMARLSKSDGVARESVWKAAASAYWGLTTDPTKGATHYLQIELTKKLRGGTLPAWAASPSDSTEVDQNKVTVMIMDHCFLRV